MHKKMVKAVAGSFVAATMLATSAAAMIPMGAFVRITALVRLTLTTASVFRGILALLILHSSHLTSQAVLTM